MKHVERPARPIFIRSNRRHAAHSGGAQGKRRHRNGRRDAAPYSLRGFMSNKQVSDKLRDRGFRLVSQNRHKKFRDAMGRTIIMSTSPSDVNAENAQMRDIVRVSSAPVYSPVVSRSSTAALSPAAKHKSGVVGNGNGNGKIATYIKNNAPLTSQEQREADRLSTEYDRLRQRLGTSSALLQRQCDTALTYAYQLILITKERKYGAGLVRDLRKRPDFNYQEYLRRRPAIYAMLKTETKKYAGKLTIDVEVMMPWILGLTDKVGFSSDQPPEKQSKGEMEIALKTFLNFVPFPQWMGPQPDHGDPGPFVRRQLRFFPPPAGLRKF
jgi:hypothetical protein